MNLGLGIAKEPTPQDLECKRLELQIEGLRVCRQRRLNEIAQLSILVEHIDEGIRARLEKIRDLKPI